MALLTAKFKLPIAAACLVRIPDKADVQFNVTHGAFEASVALLLDESWRTKGKDESDWTTSAWALSISLTRDEPIPVPAIIETPNGGRDLTVRGGFLHAQLDDYKTAAHEIANRVLKYFRYRLLTPSVRLLPHWDQALASPIWYNSQGHELGPSRVVMAQPIPGVHGELGVLALTLGRIAELAQYVASPVDTPLELTLLSDAQTAWFEDNLRRTVLELAICAEVLVKRRYFSAASPAGAAFDYLEDRSKISVRVLELLDAISLEAFAKSYRVECSEHYKSIDALFRCRNKIAHRGELTYRDDSGQLHHPDKQEIAAWWASVSHLRGWLAAL